MVPGFISTFWTQWLRPMLRRPRPLQVAALCRRSNPEDGASQILLVTSKGSGRWILPKGWPGRKRDGPSTALAEAWEEAGLQGARVLEEPVGEYEGAKGHEGGLVERCRVIVYAVEGGRLVDDFPEAGKRRRRWVGPVEASRMVEEPSLRDFLASL